MTPTPTETIQAYAEAVFETIPFQAVAHGATEAAAHFDGFFRAFPDYTVELEYLCEAGDRVFEFHQMCAQLGLSTDDAAAHFAAWRAAA